MPVIGLHCSHEQIPPSRLLEQVREAEAAGEVALGTGLVRVDRARLWTLSQEPPLLVGAAVSAATACWCGSRADGLVTINQPREMLERVIAAFREDGGKGRPVHLQVHLSWAAGEDEVLRIAHDQRRTLGFEQVHPHHVGEDLRPFIDAFGERVLPELAT